MRSSVGAEHTLKGYIYVSSIRSGGTCWSVQAIHWLSKGKANREAGRHMGRQEGGLNRERQIHHGPNSYSHNSTGWHLERSELGSLLHTVLVSIVSFQTPTMNQLRSVQFHGSSDCIAMVLQTFPTLVSVTQLWPSLALLRKIVDRLVFPLLGDSFRLHCQAGG